MLTTLPQPATAVQPAPPDSATLGRWNWLLVLLLIVLGAALRLAWFHRAPPLWWDEVMVAVRTGGSYQYMLDRLQLEGVGPLYDQLYWLIAHIVWLTPPVLRLVSTLSGILMIPAMYFLARQFVSQRTALLVAAFTATSAFLVAWSRDASMYQFAWLFCVLHMGCMLWFFRSLQRVAWLAWIASGLVAVGTHPTALLPLAIAPLILVTYWPPSWRRIVLFLIGTAVLVAAPVGYKLSFDRLAQQIQLRPSVAASSRTPGLPSAAGWGNSPIYWVQSRNSGLTGPELVLDSTCAFLIGWERAGEVKWAPIPPERAATATWVTLILLAWVTAGLVPWPEPWRQWRQDRLGPYAWWRLSFWLAAWIVLPAYAFYCYSMPHFVPPAHWIGVIEDTARKPLVAILTCSVGIILVGSVWIFAPDFFQLHVLRRRVRKLVQLALVVAAIFGLCYAIYAGAQYYWEKTVVQVIPAIQAQFTTHHIVRTPAEVRAAAEALVWDQEWMSKWLPRFLAVAWPAFAIALCTLIMRLPLRVMRFSAAACLLGANLFMSGALIWARSEPPLDLQAADIRQARIPEGPTRAYADIIVRGNEGPGTSVVDDLVGRYYLALAHGIKPEPNGNAFGSFIEMPSAYRYQSSPDHWARQRAMHDALRSAALSEQDDARKFARSPVFATFIAADLLAHPTVDRAIVWDRIERDNPKAPDDLAPLLTSAGWKCTRHDLYPVRVHWTWQDLYYARRREYIRIHPPATRPTTPASK